MGKTKRDQKRRDKKGRILRNGESQRKDGRYAFVYTDCYGKQKFLYSWKLEPTDSLPTGCRPCLALREKEKNIQRIEYEKLLFQINPHFLLNTLNSIQWMARMSHQDNITEFVQRLKKLLSYNLGKEGMQTTLRTEIDIVKEYIALQQMRYDFVIEMNVEEGSYLEQPTVRMLLQPLVENAIQYGLGKDEKITIRIFEDNKRGLAAITIADSGNGLTREEIDQINAPFDYDLQKMQNGNRGIGLRYVKAMLDSFYEGQTNLFVNCKKGYGTKITILIPVQEELRDKAKVADTGIEKEGMRE